MLLAVIAACEIGFWVLLAAGLATRYLLRLPKAGMVLLAGVPLVDVVMLVASVIDIQRGGEPSFKHSLAAIFIGVSVGFGHQTLKWADKWAAHYLAGAPRPVKPPKGGRGAGPPRARRLVPSPARVRRRLRHHARPRRPLRPGVRRPARPGVDLDDRPGHRRHRLLQLPLRRRRAPRKEKQSV